jgi:transcription initiation factor TFIID subunit 6
LPTHFGAISGLSALGPRVVRLLILPNLKQYLEVLEPHMARQPYPVPDRI